MRILRIADVPASPDAGMSGAMLQGGRALVEAGHEVQYLFREQLLSDRIPTRTRRLFVPVMVVVRVAALHKATPLDVVEVHEPLGAWYGLLTKMAVGRRILPPVVVLVHALEGRCWQATLDHRARNGVRTALWSRVSVRWTLLAQSKVSLTHADHVVVLNSADQDLLLSDGMDPETVSCVPNGVDRDQFAIPRSPAAHLRLVFLGSWIERKGIAELAQAWEAVHREYPSVTLTLAGVGHIKLEDHFGGPSRSAVSSIPSVERGDLPHLLAKHDVLVLPSWFEGMPLVALEAAAASVAVVAARIPGVTDIFRPVDPVADGAVLFAHEEPGGLVEALRRLAGDAALVERLQRAAKARAADFSWETTGQGLAAAYARAAMHRASSTAVLPRRGRRRRLARRHEPT